MLSTLTYTQLEHPDAIQRLRENYLHALVAPMDGMWESTAIAHATFWEIQDRGQHAGHFCIDANNYLLRFQLVGHSQVFAREIFRRVISTYTIQHAIASTIEPLYFSLCLDIQIGVTLHSYLFRDTRRIEPPHFSNITFR